MIKKIFFTGGGSAGHVTPNIAIINELKKAHWIIHYIGTATGIEKKLILPLDIPYHSIPTGKLRRYFSWQNFIDPFKLLAGIIKSTMLIYRHKPAVIFSKGGFVSLPVVIAGWINRTPVILHESDLTPGLANKLSFPFAKIIFCTFAETARFFKDKNKIRIVGTPIRPALLAGTVAQGLAFTQFNQQKPIILIICGSLGSKLINQVIRQALPLLTAQFSIIHICGKDNLDTSLNQNPYYRQYEYLNQELADVFACADLVISRAGANSLYELLALKKLHILIPLSKKASRGDQIDNARYFKHAGLSLVLEEEKLTIERLLATINQALQQQNLIQQKLAQFLAPDSLKLIVSEIEALAPKN